MSRSSPRSGSTSATGGVRLARRMGEAGASVFTEMSHLAQVHQAVNLGQGFPDFAGPDWVKQAAANAIAADINQYALSQGATSLRREVARMAGPRLGRALDADAEVTITSGATEAVFAAMQALVNPGDEVIVFDPAYESYGPAITYPGGIPVPVPLHGPDTGHERWWFDDEELRRAVGRRTRLLMLNTPHNPTGKVFSESELDRIAAVCVEHDLIALTDEVYEYLTFGVDHVSLATRPGMWERTLTISSSAKTFSVTGWKIGWALGPAALVRGVRAAHTSMVFCAPAPLQEGIAAGLAEAEARGYYGQLRAQYQERRDSLVATLEECGLATLPCEGSYFLLCDISRLGYANDIAFCRDLTVSAGVTAIPPSAFYSPRYRHLGTQMARFAFCKRMETLEEAARRLARWRERR